MAEITWQHFEAVELRAGTIIDVADFPEARKPAYKITVDFGPEIGVKRTSAQFTALYSKEGLLGRQVLGVVNFAVRVPADRVLSGRWCDRPGGARAAGRERRPAWITCVTPSSG